MSMKVKEPFTATTSGFHSHSSSKWVRWFTTNRKLLKIIYFQQKFSQGLLFYIPHWIWKNWEEGRMRMISEGLRGVISMPREERRARQNRIVRYLVDSIKTHNTYAFGYFFCEFLNVVNVVSRLTFSTNISKVVIFIHMSSFSVFLFASSST